VPFECAVYDRRSLIFSLIKIPVSSISRHSPSPVPRKRGAKDVQSVDQALASQAVNYRLELPCRSGRFNVRPSAIFLRGCNGFNVDLTSLHHDLRGYASSTERSRENHRTDGRDKPGRDASS
jgi:hypothetical protein